jgi:hypothetical protein
VGGVALVTGAAAVARGSGTSRPTLGMAAAAAKPGPGAPGPSKPGVIVWDNTGSSKASAVAAIATTSDLSPDLNGYRHVDIGRYAPAHSQTFGDAPCPSGRVAFGGGLYAPTSPISLTTNINSSYPEVSGGVATGWAGYVNNTTDSQIFFVTMAVCAWKPANYAVVAADFDNLAGSQNSGSVQCPLASSGRMKVFSGGAFGASGSLLQNINTTIPLAGSKSWRVDMNNASDSDATFTVYAVCGKKAGWNVTAGPAVPNPAKTSTRADAFCPSGLTAVGAGVFSSANRTSVNVWGSYPAYMTSSENFENNASSKDFAITPYVVCLS